MPSDDPRSHHVLLVPGLFGFATLAGYDYFQHLEHAIAERFRAAGAPLVLARVPSLPTASIKARAAVLARSAAASAGGGAIHLVGHSSGGLDARLLLSPSVDLGDPTLDLSFRRRVRSVVGINTPNHGTPLAAYFSTVSGTRLLYVVSLLTVATLSIGHLPLSGLATLISAVRHADATLGLDIVDDVTERVLGVVGDRGRREIRDFMGQLMQDQAGIIQLMPEVMELFNAAVEDAPFVRYGSVATFAPPPGPRRLLRAVLSPTRALQLATYTTLFGIASRASPLYPYARPDAVQAIALARRRGADVGPDAVDGIIPTLSMLWGELLWCGAADHLDVVGHFEDDVTPSSHVDWLHSGAHFSRRDFASMVDALCEFLLRPPLSSGSIPPGRGA